MKLTKAAVAQLALHDGQSETLVWDDNVPGLGVRVRAGGSRNWIFQYRIGPKQRRMSLGSATAVSVADARTQAAKLHARVRLGEDPAAQKVEAAARAAETFEASLSPYLARQAGRLKPRSFVEIDRHLRVHSRALHRLPLAKIDRRAIATLSTEVAATSGPGAANRTRSSLLAFFAWAMRDGLIDANPVIGTNKQVEEGARERILSDQDIRALWAGTAPNDQYHAIVRLLLLTGARRGEIGSLCWSEVDLDKTAITLSGERTKNSRPFVIPLSAAALAILEAQPRRPDREFVFGVGKGGFSGWSQSKARLDQRLQIAPWRLHDLRHCLSTTMHERLGVQPHIVEAVLNHVSGHQGGVAGVYNKATYLDEKTVALARWAEHVASLVEGCPAKVIGLRA
jgi:integrase